MQKIFIFLLLAFLLNGLAESYYANQAVDPSGLNALPHWKQFQELKGKWAENPPEGYMPLTAFKYDWGERGLYCHVKRAYGLACVPGLNSWVYTQYGERIFRPFADNGMTDVWVGGRVFCTTSPYQILVWELMGRVTPHPLNR